LTVWIIAVAISPPKTGNRIKNPAPVFVRSILTAKPSALVWRLLVGFAVALPPRPGLFQRTEWTAKWIMKTSQYQLTINNPQDKGLDHEAIKERLKQLTACSYFCLSDEIGIEGGRQL